MEVRFRALRDSTLNRNVSSGQLPAGEGQSFLEVVESVAGTEQTPGENLHSARNKQEQAQKKNRLGASAADDNTGDASKDPVTISPHDKVSPPHNKVVTNDEPLGARIDMTV